MSNFSFLFVVDGNLTMWSNWTECSNSCGGGIQYRNRSCNNPAPMYGGMNCSHLGEMMENRTCANVSCPGTKFVINFGNYNS